MSESSQNGSAMMLARIQILRFQNSLSTCSSSGICEPRYNPVNMRFFRWVSCVASLCQTPHFWTLLGLSTGAV